MSAALLQPPRERFSHNPYQAYTPLSSAAHPRRMLLHRNTSTSVIPVPTGCRESFVVTKLFFGQVPKAWSDAMLFDMIFNLTGAHVYRHVQACELKSTRHRAVKLFVLESVAPARLRLHHMVVVDDQGYTPLSPFDTPPAGAGLLVVEPSVMGEKSITVPAPAYSYSYDAAYHHHFVGAVATDFKAQPAPAYASYDAVQSHHFVGSVASDYHNTAGPAEIY